MLEQLEADDAVVGGARDRERLRRVGEPHVEADVRRFADVVETEIEPRVRDRHAGVASVDAEAAPLGADVEHLLPRLERSRGERLREADSRLRVLRRLLAGA